jgi:hypothetical protein
MAPTNIDQATYVTCRQAHAMNPEARKALAMGNARQPGRGQGRCGRYRLRGERDWLVISGGLHSVSLTKACRRRVAT